MDFKSKASITLTGVMSAAAVVAAARGVPGFHEAVFTAAQGEAEASKSAAGLTLADCNVTFADDGSATIDLVYEKVDTILPPSAGQGAPNVAQQPAQNGAAPPVLPLSLQPLGLTPAAA